MEVEKENFANRERKSKKELMKLHSKEEKAKGVGKHLGLET